MQLGAFSISLTVKDIAASRTFYEKFGFTVFAGNGKNYVIMKNGDHVIGLFHGMFEKPRIARGQCDTDSSDELRLFAA